MFALGLLRRRVHRRAQSRSRSAMTTRRTFPWALPWAITCGQDVIHDRRWSQQDGPPARSGRFDQHPDRGEHRESAPQHSQAGMSTTPPLVSDSLSLRAPPPGTGAQARRTAGSLAKPPPVVRSLQVSATLAASEAMTARLRKGQPTLPLAFGEAGLPVAPVLRDALAAASRNNSYGPVAGCPELRAAA